MDLTDTLSQVDGPLVHFTQNKTTMWGHNFFVKRVIANSLDEYSIVLSTSDVDEVIESNSL